MAAGVMALHYEDRVSAYDTYSIPILFKESETCLYQHNLMQVYPQLYDMHYTFVDIKMWDIIQQRNGA